MNEKASGYGEFRQGWPVVVAAMLGNRHDVEARVVAGASDIPPEHPGWSIDPDLRMKQPQTGTATQRAP